MTLSRFAYSLLAYAALQSLAASSWAQTPVSLGAALATTSVPLPVSDVLTSPQKSSAEGGQNSENSLPAARPRVMQGNDQVIAPARAAAPITGAPLTFNFEEAPVADVVRTLLGDIMGVPYVLHPPIAGTVTLASRSAIAPDQAVFLLESALQANGMALSRDARGIYHVGRPDVLRALGSDVRQATARTPLAPGYGVIIVKLNYIGAGEMATILRPMVGGDAIVRVDSVRNLLIMNGTRTQAESWLELVNTFDVDLLKGMSVGLFPLKYASVGEVEAALRLVGGGGGGGAAPTVAPTGVAGRAGSNASAAAVVGAGLGEGNPLFGALRIMPVERLNSILVVTPRAEYLEQARRWIEKLDQEDTGGGGAQLFIYRVQNGNAAHLANVLNGIFGGGSAQSQPVANSGVAPGLNSSFGSTGNVGGAFGMQGSNAFGSSGMNRLGGSGAFGGSNAFGSGGLGSLGRGTANSSANMANRTQVAPTATAIGGVRIMADELNNSLLVWGTRDEYSKIETTLKRLDLPPTQVLIDASIIEVTLNDSLQYGLQWAFSGGTSGGRTGTGQLSTGSNNPNLTGSLNIGAGPGFSYSLLNSAGNVRVILNALASQDLLKVISSPSLMVLDNHTATMAVGDQVPVLSSITDILTTTGASTSTVQYRDTGVSLAVTPSVNAGNLVTMQIDQMMTDQSASTGANNQPIFLQRQIASKVAVRSGETIVLGGLIKDNRSSGKAGVPLLKDLPLLGNLFSNTNSTGKRTELLVVISPRVVRTDPEIRDVSEELRDRLKGLQVMPVEPAASSRASSPLDKPAPFESHQLP